MCLYSIIQTTKHGYQPMTVAITPPPRDLSYEPLLRDGPLRELPPLPEPQMCEPLGAQPPHHPSLMIVPQGPLVEASHPAVSFNSVANPPTIAAPGTKFDMTAPAVSTAPPCGLDIRPMPVTITSETVAAPAVVAAVTSVAQSTTFRPPVSSTAAAATVPVVRRRTTDKSHLLIAVGKWHDLVQSYSGVPSHSHTHSTHFYRAACIAYNAV